MNENSMNDACIIKEGTIIKRDIITESKFAVEGVVEGKVESQSAVAVGGNGAIYGGITAEKVGIASGSKVTGDIVSNGDVVVSEDGIVIGNVTSKTGNILCKGSIKGDVCADCELELGENAVIEGNIQTRTIKIANGASILGSMQCGERPQIKDIRKEQPQPRRELKSNRVQFSKPEPAQPQPQSVEAEEDEVLEEAVAV